MYAGHEGNGTIESHGHIHLDNKKVHHKTVSNHEMFSEYDDNGLIGLMSIFFWAKRGTVSIFIYFFFIIKLKPGAFVLLANEVLFVHGCCKFRYHRSEIGTPGSQLYFLGNHPYAGYLVWSLLGIFPAGFCCQPTNRRLVFKDIQIVKS